MDRFQSSIEKQIKEAQVSGKFENLPGHGEPLQIDHNPYEDPTMSMAYRMLHDNGFSLPWVELGKEIDILLAEAQKKLKRTWFWYRCVLERGKEVTLALQAWEKAIEDFKEITFELNKQIVKYNLQIPLSRFERLRLNPEKIIQNIQETLEDQAS